MKKFFLFSVMLAFSLSLVFTTGNAFAIPMAPSSGSAVFDWTTLTINTTGTVTFIDGGVYSEADVNNIFATDGGPGVLSSVNISDAGATGLASSDANTMTAASSIAIAPTYSGGDIWAYSERNGVIDGGANGGDIIISVDYTLGLDINSETGGIAEGDAGAVLWIENSWTGLSSMIEDYLSGSVMNGNSYSAAQGAQTLTASLLFDAQETGAFGIASSNYLFTTPPSSIATDTTQSDPDADGIINSMDNCPLVANSNQSDTDGDNIGDVCDEFPNDPQNDYDADGISGFADNCPLFTNSNQLDTDGDGIGDACDSYPNDAQDDLDSDGISGDIDNCPMLPNADQLDSDGDGMGDVCDPFPFDTLGVLPAAGDTATLFTYQVIYTDANNPQLAYVRVHIDGDPVGIDMAIDNSGSPNLQDGDLRNGEQFSYSTVLPAGNHYYHFSASDGTNILSTIPLPGIKTGPSVTGDATITASGNDIHVIPDVTPAVLNATVNENVSVDFSQIITQGTTTVTEMIGGEQPLFGFTLGGSGVWYEVFTDATYASTIQVCIHYDETQYTAENYISLLHYDSVIGDWVDVTTSLNTAQNIVCGLTVSLSPFGVGQQTPTLISLVNFTATEQHDGGVLLEWETASEIENVGFNIWRSEEGTGEYLKINDSLIQARGSVLSGVAYSYTDDSAIAGVMYRYKLEDIDTDGRSTFHNE